MCRCSAGRVHMGTCCGLTPKNSETSHSCPLQHGLTTATVLSEVKLLLPSLWLQSLLCVGLATATLTYSSTASCTGRVQQGVPPAVCTYTGSTVPSEEPAVVQMWPQPQALRDVHALAWASSQPRTPGTCPLSLPLWLGFTLQFQPAQGTGAAEVPWPLAIPGAWSLLLSKCAQAQQSDDKQQSKKYLLMSSRL